jgi:hypothetical protein
MSSKRASAAVWALFAVIAIGLLIPVIGRARAQSNSVDSTARLKRLALAMHACNDAHGCLPPAYDAFAALRQPASVHVHLLPFIGEEALYQSFVVAGKVTPDARIDAFHAPEDATLGTGAGVQNFAANLRIFADIGQYDDRPIPLQAIMPGKTRIPTSFVCGASATMVFAPKLAACRQQGLVMGIDGGSHYDADPTSPFAAFFGENAARKPAHPSDPEATFQLAPRGSQCLVWPLLPQSFDSRGILVAYGDGSVRRVDPGILPSDWNYAMQASPFAWSSDW